MHIKIKANDIKNGYILWHQEKLWQVMKQPEHTKPGKGGAFVQVELKGVLSGEKLYERFESTRNVERVRLIQEARQLLYIQDDQLVLMSQETYEQSELPVSMIETFQRPLLQPEMILMVELHQERPIRITLPETMICVVQEGEPYVKGQTASASYKPAIMENGVKVMVPPFIENGTAIVIRTADLSYVERAKP